MALPVLDGNQSATTLSSVVTGGEHIVAHSVVSLGTTAIANIASAVSGVNIGGTVTANLAQEIIDNTGDVGTGGNRLVVGVYDSSGMQFGDNKPFPISGTVTANINGTPTVTIPQLNKVIASVATDGVADATTNFVKIGGHQSGSNQTAHIVHVSTGGAMSVDATDSVVSISNFPSTQTIAGTVTANVPGLLKTDGGSFGDGVQIYGYDGENDQARMLRADVVGALSVNVNNPISGTVTAAAPNGSLTTRFGTPTTANTAFATSAVTNASRKYLLIQNVTTGSNVITVGIGFTPTTTQGIQLTAGAGITFESSYIPTGAIYILSSVTASNFTILEA